ncbi:MAG: EthD domain-containing protein [Proteobacteria bacterium]|nr:EthD domain-containing protein [Pseudomonadota bacterium]MBT6193940.1 EthD domain-containing protein [Pseudomonadota bacterium]MBT6465247.1 EthD domain-containing protein [Pseudomonadota bacterium]MBT6674157.1 EthD domain-containing protein [Pseudomonadota bacterium]MBT7562292.1 EthD domain-containing protein [Pseudomonadota bacterium]
MIKVISVFKRKVGMGVDEFQDYWLNHHGPMVARLPSVERYVQSHTRRSGYARHEPAADGLSELWFEDTDALYNLQSSRELQQVSDDEERFIDLASSVQILVDEHVIKDGAALVEGVKNIEFVRRKHEIDVDAFQHHWREIHGPLGASIKQVSRYVQNHAKSSSYLNGRSPKLDGLALTWFKDVDAMRESAQSAEYEATRDDEENFLTTPLDFIIAQEHVLVG